MSGPGLSRRRFLNIWVLVLNYMFLGRWPTAVELRRCPNPKQEEVFCRLRTFLIACGDAQSQFSLCLEKFCERCPELRSGYMEVKELPFHEDPGLLPSEQHPELLPYRSLDADRLRLVGSGVWPADSFLDGVLRLPFCEPKFLLHGLPLPESDMPNFLAETPDECLKLAKLWDVRGLLFLSEQAVKPGLHCKVFNAFKNRECDRQIGDRRLVNKSEYHVDGLSKFCHKVSRLFK